MENMEEQERLDEGSVRVDKKSRFDLSNYHGVIITPENRREMVELYGKEAVTMAQKQYDSWLKGKSFFTYKGERYPIMTQEYLEFLESQKDFLTKLEEFKENFENEEE